MTDTDDTRPRTAHTPEPWGYDMPFIVAPDPTGQHPDIYIAEIAVDDEEGRIALHEQHEANARRICAAVNACASLSTGALEQDVVGHLLRALHWLVEDLTDAGEDANPETGEVYASVQNARDTLILAESHSPRLPRYLSEILHALHDLLIAAADLDAAIDGTTEEFKDEQRRLNVALRQAQAILDRGSSPGSAFPSLAGEE